MLLAWSYQCMMSHINVLILPLQVSQRAQVRLNLGDLLPSLGQYLSAASLVFARTWGKILAYAYCARQAALLGVSDLQPRTHV